MKCENCGKWMLRKHLFCPKCGTKLGLDARQETPETKQEASFDQQDMSKAVFITDGSIFNMYGSVQILGVTCAELAVGDIVVFNRSQYRIAGLRTLKQAHMEVGAGENCAIVLMNVDFNALKQELLLECSRNQESKQPFTFSGTPTTAYTFFFKP